MHILEIPSFFPPYGGLFCLDQAKALSVQGHEVRILSNVQLGASIGTKDYLTLPYGRYEHIMDGITVCQSYQRGIPKVIRYNVRRWVHIVQSMFHDYVTKYGQPDILHAHCAKWAGYAAMLIAQEYHIPYVVTEHLSMHLFEMEFGRAPSSAWPIALLRRAYEKADLVIPVSEELVGELSCYFGSNYHWHYVSNTIDTAFFNYHPRVIQESRPFRFCCLADYRYLKGYDVLFEAYRLLQDKGLAIELYVAGLFTDGAECQHEIARLHLQGVKTYGRIDKYAVRDLLYHCDALVLASRSEVQPLVLLEAMSTGIPAVSTECIPACLRIKDGCTIVPIADAQALANAMETVSLQQSFDGEALSGKVSAMASPDVVGSKLEKLFSGILASH